MAPGPVYAAATQAPPSFTQQALDDCRLGKPFLLYDAEEGIVDALQQLEDAQAAQKEERRIGAASGVRNLSVDYELGRRVVGARNLLDDSWKQYRAAGGKAKSPKDVRALGANPCPDPSVQLPAALRQ